MMSSPMWFNEEQIITSYPIDGAIGRSGDGMIRKFSDVCLDDNAMVAKGILVTNIGTPELPQRRLYC